MHIPLCEWMTMPAATTLFMIHFKGHSGFSVVYFNPSFPVDLSTIPSAFTYPQVSSFFSWVSDFSSRRKVKKHTLLAHGDLVAGHWAIIKQDKWDLHIWKVITIFALYFRDLWNLFWFSKCGYIVSLLVRWDCWNNGKSQAENLTFGFTQFQLKTYKS